MAQKRIDRKINVEKGTVTFTVLADGSQLVCNVGEVAPKYEKLPTVAQRLLFHAVNAKVGDSAADPKLESPMLAMETTWKQLLAGEWTSRGEGGGGSRRTVLAEAIAQVKGLDVDEVAAKLADLDDETKKGLRKNPRVKAAIADINAKRAEAKAQAAGKEAEGAADDFEL